MFGFSSRKIDKFIKLVDAFLQDCSKNYFTQSSRSSQSIDYEHSAFSACNKIGEKAQKSVNYFYRLDELVEKSKHALSIVV